MCDSQTHREFGFGVMYCELDVCKRIHHTQKILVAGNNVLKEKKIFIVGKYSDNERA